MGNMIRPLLQKIEAARRRIRVGPEQTGTDGMHFVNGRDHPVRLDLLKVSFLSFVDLGYFKASVSDPFPSSERQIELDQARGEFQEYCSDNFQIEWDVRCALAWTLNLSNRDWPKIRMYLEVPWPRRGDEPIRAFLETLWDYTFRHWNYRRLAEGPLRTEIEPEWLETLTEKASVYLEGLGPDIIIPESLEDVALDQLADCFREIDQDTSSSENSDAFGNNVNLNDDSIFGFVEWSRAHPDKAGAICGALRWLINQEDVVLQAIMLRMGAIQSGTNITVARSHLTTLWDRAFGNWKIDGFRRQDFTVVPPEVVK